MKKVHSDTLNIKCNGHKIYFLQSLGMYPWIFDKHNQCIGRIIPLKKELQMGENILIEKIELFEQPDLSDKLTDEFKNNTLILSSNDEWS